MTWSRRFDVPIVLPSGKTITTLADARTHLLALPESEHHSPAFRAALEAVVMAGEGRGPVMHANVGIGRLVHGPKPIPEPRPATTKWGRRTLARDR